MTSNASKQHKRREQRGRAKIRVTNKDCKPRLSVFRSGKHIYAQLINDEEGKTIVSASTLEKEVKNKLNGNSSTKEGAATVGKLIAERAKAQGITKVVFDRGGYMYHGRVAALAEAARSELDF